MNYGREEIMKQIRSDKDLMEEILTKVSERPDFGSELATLEMDAAPVRPMALESMRAPADVDEVRRILETPPPQPTPGDSALEAIILRVGRPVLKIRNDSFDTAELGTDVWSDRLSQFRENLVRAILSVGRIELENHLNYSWAGTGWVIDEDIIVTNRHVAQVFAQKKGHRFVFRQSFLGVMQARIDFREEHLGGNPMEYPVTEVLHIESDDGPDLAFLRVDWDANPALAQRKPLPLSSTVPQDHFVATVGYPAKDTRTNISAEMDALFGNIYNVKRLAPGQVMHIFDDERSFTHDCTTLGGNSGSVVFDMESGEVLGLHFAGKEEVANFAVSAPVVKQRLDERSQSFTIPVGGLPATPDEVGDEKAPSAQSLSDRSGYAPMFLGEEAPLPQLSQALQDDVAPVDERDDGLLHYTHHSVVMHAERRLAIYTACNIDGRQWRHILRDADKWLLDPRIDRKFQVGNELYKSNKLDRGHLVRRLDPTWGDSFEIADQAEKDTFFYTNCAPQHKNLNRDLWLGLEDHILTNTDVHDLKVSVFGGPVFRESDRIYRDIQIPEDFWKVVAMLREDTGRLSVTAYLLSQRDFMDDLEFAFGAYQTYQVPVAQIEELTGLDFGSLKEFDPLAEIEAALPYFALDSLDQISL